MRQPKYDIVATGKSLQECDFKGQCTSGNLPAYNVVSVATGQALYLGSYEHCVNYIDWRSL